MNHITKADLYRYKGSCTFKTFLFYLIRIPGFRFMYLWRNTKKYGFYNPIGILLKLLYIHFTYKYGFQIPLHCTIGKGFYIGHFGAIVINRAAIIGENCNISHNVTIGQTNRGALKGVPTIGNRVWIGAGAVIVGKVRIGDNVLIAANSYVNFDVPSDSLVIGNPGRIVKTAKDITAEYVINILDEDISYKD